MHTHTRQCKKTVLRSSQYPLQSGSLLHHDSSNTDKYIHFLFPILIDILLLSLCFKLHSVTLSVASLVSRVEERLFLPVCRRNLLDQPCFSFPLPLMADTYHLFLPLHCPFSFPQTLLSLSPPFLYSCSLPLPLSIPPTLSLSPPTPTHFPPLPSIYPPVFQFLRPIPCARS